MSDSKYYKLAFAAAIAFAGGLAVACFGAGRSDTANYAAISGLLVALLCCGGVLLWGLLRHRKLEEQMRRYIEAMCLWHKRPGPDDNMPVLSANHPMSEAMGEIRKILHDCRRRVEDLEHGRSAQEVHCLRAAKQAEQIRNIFEGLTDPILAVDSYGDLALANRSAEETLHFDAKNVETRALGSLLRCQKLVDLLTTVRKRKLSGPRSEEIELADENGESKWYRATACKLAAEQSPSSDMSVGPEGAVVVLRDIGDLKSVQKRNAEFVSSVSHEMKTPLAGIKAYVELLADGEAEDETSKEEFLNVISTQADRLQRLVENLLNIARIEAGVVHVNKQQHSLNQILEEALHVVQPAAEAKQIELVSRLSSMYLGVLADRDMLLQAAINLLSNAIKYTREGGTVTLTSRLVGDDVRFEVQDTGVGLSPEDCQRVFEKFYRVKKDKDMAQGTGLGLPLAKHIVEDVHGGQLAVESTPDVGSTFSISMRSAGQMKTEG